MSSYTYQWKFIFLLIFTSLATLKTSIVCCNSPQRDTVQGLDPTDMDSSSPQQVHISLSGKYKMRVSWVTKSKVPAVVFYGTSKGNYEFSAKGIWAFYEYGDYESGYIYKVVIGPLMPATTYFYQCGKKNGKEYTLHTPPASFPLKFGVVGDLGLTERTKATLQHLQKSEYDVFLLPGDLSYADGLQPVWDTFGRLVEPLASQKPWMVAAGNHEIELKPSVHNTRFTAYNIRWLMPFRESKSPSNLFYSFDVAGAHVIVLASYAPFEDVSPQYKWLQADLELVDRSKTPWLIVIIHAPWYNSYMSHQNEFASVSMKHYMEKIIRNARVDIVFAGHVHAYERFTRVMDNRANPCGAVHITVGTGGNKEGLAVMLKDPQPITSVIRESSYGHGQLLLVNETHAKWTWHKNEDDQANVADSVWIESLASNNACK